MKPSPRIWKPAVTGTKAKAKGKSLGPPRALYELVCPIHESVYTGFVASRIIRKASELNGPFTVKQCAEWIGKTPSYTSSEIATLRKRGIVRKVEPEAPSEAAQRESAQADLSAERSRAVQSYFARTGQKTANTNELREAMGANRLEAIASLAAMTRRGELVRYKRGVFALPNHACARADHQPAHSTRG